MIYPNQVCWFDSLNPRSTIKGHIPVGQSSGFIVFDNDNNLGTYLMFYNNRRPKRGWVQINMPCDSVRCTFITKRIVCFEFYFLNVFTNITEKRIIFSTTRGHISKNLIELDADDIFVEQAIIDKNEDIILKTTNISSSNAILRYNRHSRRFSILNESSIVRLSTPTLIRVSKIRLQEG